MNYWRKVIGESEKSKNCWNKCAISSDDTCVSSNEYVIQQKLFEKILTVSNGQDIIIYLIFITSIAVMYKKYSNSEKNFIIGCHPINIEKQMAKILPLVGSVEYDETILELLNYIKQLYIELNNNCNIQVNELSNIIKEKFIDTKEYITTSVIMSNIYNGEDFLSGEELIFQIDKQDTIKVKIIGKGSKYNKVVLDRLFRHLKKVLETVVNEPNTKIKNINMLEDEEKNKLLYEYNNTYSKYSDNKTMVDIWEDTVKKHSERCAVIYKNKKMTYKELDERSNDVAIFLRNKGISRNDIVGLMLNRSFEMLIGILGIIKAGAAYMPILPTYPKDRIEYVIKDSNTSIVLLTEEYMDEIPSNVDRININEIPYANERSIKNINKPNDYLYLIYTSGSTGEPKGILTKHNAFINRIEWMINKLSISEKDVILQKTSFCFDVSVCELLLPSFLGAAVCMLEQGAEMDPSKILKCIKENNISIIHFVPSMLDEYIKYLYDNKDKINEMLSIKYVICSGEALKAFSVNSFFNLFNNKNCNCNLINLYGPTETAIEVTYFECLKNNNYNFIPIGKPISNVKTLIMDKDLNPVPIGVPGELCIGGIAVSDGYLNKEELTKEKFVDCEYVNGKIYKTGDLVRLLDDGNIEYICRIDNQVKIRGFRIELGEIETSLLEHKKIEQAAVLVKNENNENYICAYIVANDDIDITELKRHMKKKLPAYMIPNYFMKIGELPVTSNGKLDTQKLLDLKLTNNQDEYVAPENETEEKMVNIFKDILKVDYISVNDSFFDLGGHSLKIVSLISKIYDEFNITVSIEDIFKYETVRKLSKKILKNKAFYNVLYEPIPKLNKQEYYETSSAQKRIYTIQKSDTLNTSYNIPICIVLEGKISIEKVSEIFNKIIDRHEAFRTTFKIINGELKQHIHNKLEFHIDELDLRHEDYKNKFYEFIQPFDLENGPLIRVSMGAIGENRYILFIDIHHIISDGISIEILINEFKKLLNNEKLDELTITYKDYSKWMNNNNNSKLINKQKEYWLDKFKGDIPVLNIPTDYNRLLASSNKGKVKKYKLDFELTKEIQRLCNNYSTTEYVVLISILFILLNKYSNQKEIIIGSPVAGRKNSSLKNIIGMFVNTIAIRSNINKEFSYKEFLLDLKEEIIKDLENQDYQFDELVAELGLRPVDGRNQLFDIMFSVQNSYDNELIIPDLKVYIEDREETLTKFDLNITAILNDSDIELEIEYKSTLYNEQTIDTIYDDYIKILKCISKNNDVLIDNIDCINKKYKTKVNNINYFNRYYINSFDNNASIKEYTLSKDISQKILAFCNHEDKSLYLLVLCSIGIMSEKYSSNEDFKFGCLQINTNKIELFSGKIEKEKSFLDNLKSIKNKYIEFSNNFNMYNIKYLICEKDLIFDISIENTIKVKIKGEGNKYTYKVLDRLFNHLEKILETVINNQHIKINDINMLGEEEKNNIIFKYNNTDFKYSNDKTIFDIWEKTVFKYPNNCSIIYEDKKMTYKELDERSNSIAVFLRSKGVTRNSIVGIMLNRSFEMLIGIIGIIKAGGTYMPILPTYPIDRINYMIEDSKTSIILSTEEVINNIPESVIKVNINEIPVNNSIRISNVNKPSDYLYLIYTSGSTGKPKGVLTSHTACINRIEWMINKLNLTEKDTILQKTSFCFDVSVWELLLPSFLGAKLCMLEQGDEMDSEKIMNVINKNKISVIHFVPSMLNSFIQWLDKNENKIDNMSSISHIICSGEVLEATNINYLNGLIAKRGLNCDIINLYGPTEAAIDVSYFECEKDTNYAFIPIGKPIDNVKLLVVNEKLELVPIGVPGELCIGGIAVSDGYLNKENLTKEKFVKCNYINERVYKTGDFVRLLDDGNIEYISRKDDQVKIRGFRIELGEIETRLLEFNKVKQAKVLANKDIICAYIVCNESVTNSQIKEFLEERLPYYMIPNYFIRIKEMPVTTNGKVDKKKLLSMDLVGEYANQYVEPESEIEIKLANIFKDTLNIEKIGVNDSFFDLGGHSLKAAILTSKIYEEFKITISIKDIFKYETVRKLSKKLLELKPSNNFMFEQIPVIEKKEYYETSSAQKRIYTLQKFNKDSVAYNIPVCFLLEGNLDFNKVEDVFNKLIERHESLRTTFKMIGSNIVQIINDKYKFTIDKLDITLENYKTKYYEFIRPFNLESGPLFRVAIGNVSKEKNIMFIDMHHSISDGVSINILMQDFLKLYNNAELEEIPITYKDYSEWINTSLKNGSIKIQEEYWVNKLSKELPILNLPTDFSRTEVKNHIGKIVNYKLGKERTKKIEKLCKDKSVTEYIVLMSIINILFSKYSGEEDIIIGTPIATRRNVNIQKVVGLFVNTLAIRSKVNGEIPYNEFLQNIKKNILEDFENQDYQFNDLVSKLNIHSEYNRNPLFDVIFSLENWHEMDFQIPGLKVSQMNINESMTKFDLNITSIRNKDDIEFNIEYSVELFKEETINRMFNHYLIILDQVLEHEDILIKNIQCMDASEKQLFIDYNNTYKKMNYLPIISYIRECVLNNPHKVAIVENNKKINYEDLWTLANKIASYLLLNGVKKGDFVAVIGNSSIESIACFIGILIIRAAFIPIDKDWPLDRCKYVIQKNECNLTLNADTIHEEVDKIDNVKIDDFSYDVNDIMYSIYTSGSTGKPKGVIVTQKSVVNTILDINSKFNIDNKDIFMTLSSIGFDLSIFDIFSSLILGAKIVLIDNIKDISKIRNEIIKNKVTIWNSVPEIMSVFVDNIKEQIGDLRLILLSGDKIPITLPNKIKNVFLNSQIISLGGATEGAIWSIYYPINETGNKIDKIPYGKPLANQQIYILDKWNKQCPIGTIGEICIGGYGVAKGYYKDKDRTLEKFINHEEYGYIYKTGDLGLLNRDGNVEIIGRNDRQVKINGYRVELGEIENTLISMDDIREAVVFLSNKDNFIYACVTINNEISEERILEYISKILPHYMLPKKILIEKNIPYTFNGKLDLKRIEQLADNNKSMNNYIEPIGEKEIIITEIFKNVLGREKISVCDSFFDIGVNSLQAMSIIYQINETLGCELPINILYENLSIKQLAKKVTINKYSNNNNKTGDVVKNGVFKATSMQKYFYKDYKINPIQNNAAMYVELDVDIEKEEIEDIMQKLILKHEALRTNFYEEGNELFQIVHEKQKIEVKVVGFIEESIEEYYKKIRKPFNFKDSPLIRIYLAENKNNKHIILIEYHEIVADGIAISLLMDEFMKIYNGIPINTMQYSYIDYCEKSNMLRKSSVFENEKKYWIDKFDSLDKLQIKKEVRGKADVKNYIIDQELVNQVSLYVNKYRTTEYIIYLSIINLLIKDFYNLNEIIIGAPIAGRRRKEERNLIGVLTNIIPIYTKIDNTLSYEEYLKKLTANVLMDFENQDILIYELFDFLSIKFNKKVDKLFDIMFSLTDNTNNMEEDNELSVNSIILDDTANNLLHFSIEKCDKVTYMSIKYDSSKFLEKDIDLLFNKFVYLINNIIINCNNKLN